MAPMRQADGFHEQAIEALGFGYVTALLCSMGPIE